MLTNTRRLSQNQFIGLKKDLPLKMVEGTSYIAVDIDSEELYIYNVNEDPILIASSTNQSPHVPNDRVFIAESGIPVALSGNPTYYEVQAWNDALPIPFTDTMLYYTGTDVGTDEITHVFHSDNSGNISPVIVASPGLQLGTAPEFISIEAATASLGLNQPFRWSENNIDGVPSPRSSQIGVTK